MPTAARDPAIRAVLKRPFAEQVAFFRGKLGNLVPTQTWRDLRQAEHDKAFMVAGAAKADLLADLAAAVDRAIAEGGSIGQFRRDFGAIVARTGWDFKGGRNWRTRVIYTTNAATSYAAGRLAQLQQFAVWVYKHNDSVLHPRPIHLSWDGLVLPREHPFWQTHYPPNGWGCKCRAFGVSDPALARKLGGDPDKPLPGNWQRIDPQTGAPVGIDAGWAYAPGATATSTLRGLLPQASDDLPDVCLVERCILDTGPPPPLPAARAAAPERLLPEGRPADWYVQRFLDEFGVPPGEVRLFEDVAGDAVLIGRELFTDRKGALKALKRGRERHLLLLADTIKSPDEIWLALDRPQARGRPVLRRRYVARWLIAGSQVPALVVFEWARDLWRGVTAFGPDDIANLERRGRVGQRIWTR